MNTMMTYKEYSAHIDYDYEDQIYVGTIAGIRDGVGFHAEEAEALEPAFHEAVDDYVDTCKKIGKEPQKPSWGDNEIHSQMSQEPSGPSL